MMTYVNQLSEIHVLYEYGATIVVSRKKNHVSANASLRRKA